MKSRIAKLRKNKGYTKTEIAKMLKVSLPTYTMWEKAKRLIPTSRIFQLSNIYEINIDYLIGLVDIKINRKNETDLNLKEIGEHLKEIRLELNMSKKTIAKLLNIPKSRWLNYEAGKYLITSWILLYVCQKTGISIDYVLGRSKLKYLKDLK